MKDTRVAHSKKPIQLSSYQKCIQAHVRLKLHVNAIINIIDMIKKHVQKVVQEPHAFSQIVKNTCELLSHNMQSTWFHYDEAATIWRFQHLNNSPRIAVYTLTAPTITAYGHKVPNLNHYIALNNLVASLMVCKSCFPHPATSGT